MLPYPVSVLSTDPGMLQAGRLHGCNASGGVSGGFVSHLCRADGLEEGNGGSNRPFHDARPLARGHAVVASAGLGVGGLGGRYGARLGDGIQKSHKHNDQQQLGFRVSIGINVLIKISMLTTGTHEP